MKIFAIAALLFTSVLLLAQSYNSGSDESDGGYRLFTNDGYVNFSPDAQAPYYSYYLTYDGAYLPPEHIDTVNIPDDPPDVLDADRDGVYHFMDVDIWPNSTLRLNAQTLGNRPVIWLAQGDVSIRGTLDLVGYKNADAGAGGFPGGLIGQAGMGPGANSDSEAGNATHVVDQVVGNEVASAYGNKFLVPALGGSGGDGGDGSSNLHSSGSSGGGSIVIASSTRIHLTENCIKVGIDTAGYGFYGSGGSVRLIAPLITSDDYPDATEPVALIDLGIRDSFSNQAGRLRIEAHSIQLGENAVLANVMDADHVVITSPGPAIIEPNIKITDIAGASVPQKPGASRSDPDLTIDDAGEVTVTVTAKGIPLGETVTITVWNEALGEFKFETGPLTGTLAASTASATFEVPPGKNIFLASADWREE